MTDIESAIRELVEGFADADFERVRSFLHDDLRAYITNRDGGTLHNHATHLFFVRDGRVSEWWMVEALPAGSGAFWSH